MMAEDLDEVHAPDDLDDLDGDLEPLEDGDLDGALDDEDEDALIEDDELVEDEDEELDEEEPAAPVADKHADEADEEEDEEPDDEDVEASLDVILKERLVVEDEPDDEEVADVDDRSELSERVLPKQPDEFVCRSCFLVKHPSQLADAGRMLCRDCV